MYEIVYVNELGIKSIVHFVPKKIGAFEVNEKLLSMFTLWKNISIIGNFMILRSETPPLSPLAVGTSHPSALSHIIPKRSFPSAILQWPWRALPWLPVTPRSQECRGGVRDAPWRPCAIVLHRARNRECGNASRAEQLKRQTRRAKEGLLLTRRTCPI